MENGKFEYIRVADEYNPKDSIDVPSEDDGTLLLTTIQAQFPGATGLRYRNEVTGSWRGLRISQGLVCPPPEGWMDTMFYVVRPRSDTTTKRKIEASPGQREPEAKQVKMRDNVEHIGDLIVLGLPFKATEKDMRDYFCQFGELAFVQVKKDPMNGESRGFGFVSFVENEVAEEVLGRAHNIMDRRCEVRLPRAKDDPRIPYKLFVGRLAGGTSSEDLRSYFNMFGELTDIYIPKPFRGFGFITYASSESVKRVMGSNHTVNGAHVYITFAEPKNHRDDEMPFPNMPMGASNQRSPMSGSHHASRGRYTPRNTGAYSWHNDHSGAPRS